MSNEALGTHIIYRVTDGPLAAAVEMTNDGDSVAYKGTVLGNDDVFDQVSIALHAPAFLAREASELLSESEPVLFLEESPYADRIQLGQGPLATGSNVIGGLLEDGEHRVEIVALDDPFVLGGVVIGAAALVCLAKLGLTAWLFDRADARRSHEAGRMTRVVIDGTTEAETEVGLKGKLKARFKCSLRAEILDLDGTVLESIALSEAGA